VQLLSKTLDGRSVRQVSINPIPIHIWGRTETKQLIAEAKTQKDNTRTRIQSKKGQASD